MCIEYALYGGRIHIGNKDIYGDNWWLWISPEYYEEVGFWGFSSITFDSETWVPLEERFAGESAGWGVKRKHLNLSFLILLRL